MDDDELVHDQEGETEEQRDRYRELLEETRTVMPGTQVLKAALAEAEKLGHKWPVRYSVK